MVNRAGSANFSPIITQDNQLNRIQSQVASSFNSIQGPFVGGVLIPNVTVGTGATAINHGLGRQPQVWVICDQNTQTTVARISWNTNSITLEAGSSCVISLWVN